MSPDRLRKYLLCDRNQGHLPGFGGIGNCKYVDGNFCGRRGYGNRSAERHSDSVCEKPVNLMGKKGNW